MIGYYPEFATLQTATTGGGLRLTVHPFLQAPTDIEDYSCSGLGAAPPGTFFAWGTEPANQAIVEIDPAALALGPIERDVAPPAVIAPDCSNFPGSYHTPCSQSLSCSGKVTVTRR